MPLPVVSLFSGAMGLDLGLEQAVHNTGEHLEVVVTQEYDRTCVNTIRANGYKCIPGDINRLVADDPQCNFLLHEAGLGVGDAFLVVGGPPCQPFSTAGRRQAINDPRGSLFMEFVHVVDMLRPRFFIMENVKGLLSAPGGAFEIVKQEFRRLGYYTVHGLLDAVHYGVPQFRERLFIIGSRDREEIFLPIPSHFHKHQNANYRWKTLRSAIEDLEDNPGPCAQFSEERLYYLRQVPMGGNWRNINPEELRQAMGGAYQSGGGKVGFFRRLDYDQPSPTLVTSPIHKATMLCHPTQDRPLSVSEYARLQQFPDELIFTGSITEQYKQIGNGVPGGLGKALGETLLSVALGDSEVHVKRTRGTSIHEQVLKLEQYTIDIGQVR